MLTTNDVSNLFQSMRTAYGSQWKHGPEAIGVWREALKEHSPEIIRRACNSAMQNHLRHPPTLPEFMAICKPPAVHSRPSTYLPPPKVSHADRLVNLAMMRAIIRVQGVDRAQLKRMVELKNALVEELGSNDVTRAWADDAERQIQALADNHDKEAKQKEADAAQRQFARRLGITEAQQ